MDASRTRPDRNRRSRAWRRRRAATSSPARMASGCSARATAARAGRRSNTGLPCALRAGAGDQLGRRTCSPEPTSSTARAASSARPTTGDLGRRQRRRDHDGRPGAGDQRERSDLRRHVLRRRRLPVDGQRRELGAREHGMDVREHLVARGQLGGDVFAGTAGCGTASTARPTMATTGRSSIAG